MIFIWSTEFIHDNIYTKTPDIWQETCQISFHEMQIENINNDKKNVRLFHKYEDLTVKIHIDI